MKEKPLVWIIDDDEISRYVMKRYLKVLGIQNTIDYSDSIQPLKVLSNNHNNQNKLPDIIFLDLNMPVLDGFQFLEEFKTFKNEIEKKIHIYILTSSLNDGDLTHANTVPEIAAYYIKPLKLEQLALAIKNVEEEVKEV